MEKDEKLINPCFQPAVGLVIGFSALLQLMKNGSMFLDEILSWLGWTLNGRHIRNSISKRIQTYRRPRFLKVCPPGLWIIVIVIVALDAKAQEVLVATPDEFFSAMNQATAGTTIILRPGQYSVSRVFTRNSGKPDMPIVVRSSIPGLAVIHSSGTETISVRHSFWVFEDLMFQGGPDTDHAFHIAGDADNVIIRRNVMIDFHTHIKVNGEPGQHFPDRGLIEDNQLTSNSARDTDVPVTPIDIVAGEGWVVRGNYVADFSKGQGNRTSYGIFIKGNSRTGLIERNLVICQRKTDIGGKRIGLSLGGGGTGTEFCVNDDCTYEHTGGVIRNNIVLNCSDVGIYLNKAKDSLIENNTILMTLGIDVRFPESTANVRGNVLSGAIRERDGGSFEPEDNIEFGTTLGMNIPLLSEKINLRVSDYDIKFPRWISHSTVAKIQSASSKIAEFFTDTPIGLGIGRTGECFPGLELGDITPDKSVCGDFLGHDELSDNGDDFWGTPRGKDSYILGAIDLYKSSCNLLYRIKRQVPPKTETCW